MREISSIKTQVGMTNENVYAAQGWYNPQTNYGSAETPTEEHVAKLWTEGDPVTYPRQGQQRYDPYSQTYNPGWRANPAFGWAQNQPGGGQAQAQNQFRPQVMQRGPQYAPQYRPQYQQAAAPAKAPWEVAIEALTKQIADLETRLTAPQARQPGALPSQTEVNPREHAKAVQTRSGLVGKDAQESTSKPLPDIIIVDENGKEVDETVLVPDHLRAMKKGEKPVQKTTTEENGDKPPPMKLALEKILPYPQRLRRRSNDTNMGPLKEALKDTTISLSFTDALQYIPLLPKFIKDFFANQKKEDLHGRIALNQGVSAIFNGELPPKLKDPGSFVIDCKIGTVEITKALCDSGASVSLMPLSICKKLGITTLRPTQMTLQMADKSVKLPLGVAENIIVDVKGSLVPTDFVVLEMEEDREIPLLLGRPFLATAGAVIDVKHGRLSLNIGGEKLEFNLNNLGKFPDDSAHVFQVDTVEDDSNQLMEQVVIEHMERWYADLDAARSEHVSELENDDYEELMHDMFEVSEGQAVPSKVRPPPILELKPLPAHLQYAYLGPDNTYPVIVSTNLSSSQLDSLIEVLQVHKKAIGWTIDDLVGVPPSYCTHRILMEEGHKPVRDAQRRLNPNMKEVVRKEIIKWLDAGIIYPILDSQWVSPLHVVPKKGGMTVVENQKGELVPTRTVTGYRVCVDYRKLNAATRKDHFPLPFLDQVLERLSGQEFYCFLDGYSGYNQIAIHPEDQDKTTFTCPFGTFAFRKMPFGLCNAPGTFQRCMYAIFSTLVEDCIEVFMDDFSVYGGSFSLCLDNLKKVLQRCEDVNLVLNWEKCHFMCTEGIVLGHKVSKKGIEVDMAKVNIISELPPPSNVKGIRSFLGHAGFYRRFIKDFSKIAAPLCSLLAHDVEFKFDDRCLEAFERLKRELISAPIIAAPDWNLPFELMTDASDFALGGVLGQRKDGRSHVIYYASKLLDETQKNYTITEKEMLAVVYCLEKFRSYLIGSKVVVFTDHAALRFLMKKKDAKPRLIRWVLLL